MIKMVEAVRAGDLDTVREGIAARPAGGRQGMDLGFRYEEGAVAPDGTTPPPVENPVSEYVQNACPGGRAPHMWVERDGERISTLDTFGGGFVLLTGPDGGAWRAAAEQAAAPRQVPIEVLTVGEAGDLAGAGRPLRGALRSRARRRRAGPARRLRRLARAACRATRRPMTWPARSPRS